MIATTTMTLQAILRAFFFLNVIVLFDGRPNISQSGWDKSTTSVFHSELESDQIIYTRIVIPRNANKILIKIFATTVADEAELKIDSAAKRTESKVLSNNGVLPCALLKYNGLPTFDDSDAYFQLPKSPMFLEIIDDQPYESELYIGLWGGYLLHSFRYFAGSPTVYSTGVESTIFSCGNDLLVGEGCKRTVRTLGSSSINIDAAAIAAGAGAIVPFTSSKSTSTSASASPSTSPSSSSNTSMPPTDVPPSINEQQILLEEVEESMVQVPSGSEGLVVEIAIKESHYDFCRKIIEHFIPQKKRLLEKRKFSEVKMSYRIPKLIYLNFQLSRGQLDDMRNITMATMEIKMSICDKVNIQLSASEESEPTGMERIDFRAVEMLLERPMSGPWTLSSTLSISNSSSSSSGSSSSSSGSSSSSSSSSGSSSSSSGSSTFKGREDHKVASSKDLQDFANLLNKETFMKISDSHTQRSSNSVKTDGLQEGGVNDVHVEQVSNDRNHIKEHIGRFQVSIGVLKNLGKDIGIDIGVGLDGADKIKVKDLCSDHVQSPVPVVGSGIPRGPSIFREEEEDNGSSSKNNNPHTIIPGTGRNKMFITLLIAPKILFCSSGTASYLTVQNILVSGGGEKDLRSIKEHHRNILLSQVTGANTTSTSTSSSTTSSSPSSIPLFHSSKNDTENSIAPAVCLLQIRDMISFRSSNDPPGFSRMQSEEILFSNIDSKSDYLPGESSSINTPVPLNPFGAREKKREQKRKEKQEQEQAVNVRKFQGISGSESSESQDIPSVVFRSKVPASATSYLGGGIEVTLTLRPGTLSALHGRIKNTTSGSSSSSDSRSRSDRNLLLRNKKGEGNVYGEKWVSTIAKQKFIISMRCGGLPGLQEQSTSPSASSPTSPPTASISTSSSFLFTVMRSLSSVLSSPFTSNTPTFDSSTTNPSLVLVPVPVSTIPASTQLLQSHDTAPTRQHFHHSRITKIDDVIISSSINVPMDDITLDTANAAFSYVIAGKEIKSDEKNNFLYDNNLSSESLNYAYKIRSGKRVAEKNRDDDSDSQSDVSATFKWIIRKPTINGFHGDNYLFLRMTPITNISINTSKVQSSAAHEKSSKARLKLENDDGVRNSNGFELDASATYGSEIREKHEHEDLEERSNKLHRRTWSDKQKQMKKNEVKEETDNVADAADDAFMLNFDYLAVLAVTFTPCPKGSCKHGYSAIQLGDVQSSTCICRYPWAGERCSELSVSYWFYIFQVFVLVGSNASMIPGVLLCVRIEQYMLAALLTSASIASSVYHLCDTDVYCIGGLSFLSLQIFDILFSALCMVAVIIYHSPCQKKFLPCYMIIFVSMFISPISNNPTDPRNMVSALVLSATSCFFSWVYHFMGKKVRKEASDYDSSNSSSGGHSIKVGNNNDNDNGNDDDDDLKNPRLEMRRFALFTEKAGNLHNYCQVEGNDDMSGTKLLCEEVETGKVHGDNDNERESEIENDGRKGNSSSSNSNSRGRDDAGQGADEKSCRKKTFCTIASELKLTIIGVAMGMTGIVCFATQTRSNYWLFHSFWHVFVMLSSYPLVLGRDSFELFVNNMLNM